jgi:hypothetical protein
MTAEAPSEQCDGETADAEFSGLPPAGRQLRHPGKFAPVA